MENIVSLTNLLQKALDEARQEAKSIIRAAQQSAEEMVAKATTQAEKEVHTTHRMLKQKEEAKIRQEANQILTEYRQKAAAYQSLSENRITLAAAGSPYKGHQACAIDIRMVIYAKYVKHCGDNVHCLYYVIYPCSLQG